MTKDKPLYDYILGGANATPEKIRDLIVKLEEFRLMISSLGGGLVEKTISRLGLVSLRISAWSQEDLETFSDLVIEAVRPLAIEKDDALRLDLIYPRGHGYKICGWVFYHPRESKEE